MECLSLSSFPDDPGAGRIDWTTFVDFTNLAAAGERRGWQTVCGAQSHKNIEIWMFYDVCTIHSMTYIYIYVYHMYTYIYIYIDMYITCIDIDTYISHTHTHIYIYV